MLQTIKKKKEYAEHWLLTCGPIIPDYERRFTDPWKHCFLWNVLRAAETALENRVHLFTFNLHVRQKTT